MSALRRRGAPSDPIVLTNAWVVTRDKVFNGTVEVAGEHIVAVYRGPTSLPGAVDFDGDYLLPGLVELRSATLARSLETLGPTTAATAVLPPVLAHDAEIVAAGVTTVCNLVALPDGAGVQARRMAEAIRGEDKRGATLAAHRLHVHCAESSESIAGTLAELAADPLLAMVSVPTDTEPPPAESRSAPTIPATGPSWSDSVDAAVLDDPQPSTLAHGRGASAVAQVCRRHGLRLGVDIPGSVEAIQRCAADGGVLCQHPQSEAAARIARRSGLTILADVAGLDFRRNESGRVSAQSLALLGLLDILSSEHRPSALLHAAFRLHRGPARMSLPAAIATVSCRPADLLNLVDRGEIAPGRRADLIRVRYEGCTRIREVWRGGTRAV